MGLPKRAGATLLAFAALAACVGGARAEDAEAGRKKAQLCAGCHGPLGMALAPDAPNLAGQPAVYLTEQLKAFRGGARKNEVMTLMAKPLTDDEIANLAAWFSSIHVEATPPK